jgi:hypothetical protein
VHLSGSIYQLIIRVVTTHSGIISVNYCQSELKFNTVSLDLNIKVKHHTSSTANTQNSSAFSPSLSLCIIGSSHHSFFYATIPEMEGHRALNLQKPQLQSTLLYLQLSLIMSFFSQ